MLASVPAPPSLPFTDPVLIVALATAIFLVVPLLFERLRIPGIIGLIVVGAAIGPNGAGLLARDNTIVLLGTVGLLYLMLMVGLELDLHDFNRYRSRSLLFGTLSFIIPTAFGIATGLGLGYPLGSSLLLASAFASHTLLAFPIASRLGIVKNEAVVTTLGGTILTEILALVVLAFIANAAGGARIDLGFWLRLLVPFVIYLGVVLWGLPKLGRWFFRNVRNEGTTEFVFVMVALFTVSYAAHWASVEPIIGALLVGLALNRLIPEHGTLMNRIHFVGNSLFIPFFLLSVGMLVDVRALSTVRAWTVSITLALGVTFSKWVAAKVTQKALGYTADEGWVVFGLSVPHAAGTLAIVLVGFEVRLLDQAEVNAVILTILVTCLVGPWATEHYGRRVALSEKRKPYDPAGAPRRVLVPLANPASAGFLLDLAFIVRGRESAEPLHPLMVVRGDSDDSAAEVAEAERTLSLAVLQAAGAEVPVVPLTRVDANPAMGIVRGITETRSSVVVVGWDGRRNGGQVIFGSVLDQLLEQTRQLVLVSKLGHPLNTTRRIVIVYPPSVQHHPGFLEAARVVNHIASGLGASLMGIVVQQDPKRIEDAYAAVTPALPITWEVVAGWDDLFPRLDEVLQPDDLVVLLSARRGTLHWRSRLERLPGRLAALRPHSFIAVYPPEVDATGDPVHSGGRLFDTLAPDRVVELQTSAFATALREVVTAAFDGHPQASALCGTIVRNEELVSTEILPGVILPHARIHGLAQPVVAVGISREGIVFPRASAPVRLIFLLVSPAENAEEHLRYLAAIARLLGTPAKVSELLQRVAPHTAMDWLHVDEI